MDEPSAPEVPGYHLGALLGRGSSARVYAGRRLADGRPVAVKVCPGGGADDAAVRELGALRGVGGEHVVRLLEAVPLSDALALVMERLDGGSLRQLVQARGQLTAGEVVTVLSPLAAALGGLHRAGVVHGDVSPGNVLFDETGRPALCDLGVSRIVGEEVREVWGTAGFVAPEVLLGGLPSPASDMYAVGAVGWFAATGQPPGPAWLRPEDDDPGLDPALAAVLVRCLATDPDERLSGIEASQALYDAAPAEPLLLPGHGEGVESLTRRIRAAAQVADPPSDSAPVGRRRWRVRPVSSATVAKDPPQPRHARSRRHRAVSGGAVGVLAGVFVTLGALVAVAAGWSPVDPMPHVGSTTGAAARTVDPPPPRAGQPGSGAAGGSRATSTTRATRTSRAASASGASGVRAAAAASPVDVLSRRASLPGKPIAVAQALCDARARAWAVGSPGRLSDVDASGSAALDADETALAAAAAGGWRYDGVAFTVRDSTVVGEVTTKATLRVVLDAAAYTVSGPQGRSTHPAAGGTTVRLDLVWTAAGWRVAAVSPG